MTRLNSFSSLLYSTVLFVLSSSPFAWCLDTPVELFKADYNTVFLARISPDSEYLQIPGRVIVNGVLRTAVREGSHPLLGQTYPFLQADHLSGKFSYLQTNFSPTLVFAPIYSSQTIDLQLVRDYLSTELVPSLTPNEIAVGGMLNRAAVTAREGLNAVLSQIDALPTNSLVAEAYDQISPRTSTLQARVALSEVVLQSKNLIRRMHLLRYGSYLKDLCASCPPADEDNLEGGCSQTACYCCMPIDKLGCFVTGKALLTQYRTTAMQEGYHTTTAGFQAGADYEYFNHLFTGVMLGYNHTCAKLDHGAGTVDANELIASAYMTGKIKKLWYDSLLFYTWNDYQTKRNIDFGDIRRTAKGNPDGHCLSAYLDTGRDISFLGCVIQPMGSLQYTVFYMNSYREKNAGALNLHVDNQFLRSLQGSIGATLNRRFEICSLKMMSTLRGFYVYEFCTKAPRVRAHLADTANTSFDIHSDARDKEFAVLGASLSVLIRETIMGYFDYDAEAFREHDFAQCFSLGVRGEF